MFELSKSHFKVIIIDMQVWPYLHTNHFQPIKFYNIHCRWKSPGWLSRCRLETPQSTWSLSGKWRPEGKVSPWIQNKVHVFKKSVKIKSQGQRLKIRIQTKDWEQPWYPDLLGSWRQSCRRQWTFLHQGRSTSLKSPQSENVKMLEWECERQSCDCNLSFMLILRLVNVECDLATAIPGARWTFNFQKFFPHLETFYNFYQASNMDFGQCPMSNGHPHLPDHLWFASTHRILHHEDRSYRVPLLYHLHKSTRLF